MLLTLVAAFLAVAHAQQPAFRGSVTQVEVGIAVIDEQGDFVTGLTEADFEINSFSFVDLPIPDRITGGTAVDGDLRADVACPCDRRRG